MQNTRSDKDKDKKSIKSLHPLDVWPPLPKKNIPKSLERNQLPKNKSYVEKDLLDETDVIVYDREDAAESDESERTDGNQR